MSEYKLLLVDDHELTVNGIISALVSWPRFKVVAHIDNGLEVYNACRLHEPDIVVLDLGLPGTNGLDVIPKLHCRWPEMSILAYTAYTEEYMAIKAFAAGATGYVLKNSSQQVLLAALQTVALHKRYIDPALNREVILSTISTEKKKKELLTIRERQILKLITEGYTSRLIGEQLCISIKTVETHRLNIMKKLNAHKITDLINYSRRMGLIG